MRHCQGTLSDWIVFTADADSPSSGYWGKLWLNGTDVTLDGDNNYVSGTVFEYCRIEYAETGLTLDGGSTILVDHCVIQESSNSGIHLTGSSANIVRNSQITGNQYGIYSPSTNTSQYNKFLNNETNAQTLTNYTWQVKCLCCSFEINHHLDNGSAYGIPIADYWETEEM